MFCKLLSTKSYLRYGRSPILPPHIHSGRHIFNGISYIQTALHLVDTVCTASVGYYTACTASVADITQSVFMSNNSNHPTGIHDRIIAPSKKGNRYQSPGEGLVYTICTALYYRCSSRLHLFVIFHLNHLYYMILTYSV